MGRVDFEQALIEMVFNLSKMHKAQVKISENLMLGVTPGQVKVEPFRVATRHDVEPCGDCGGSGWVGPGGSAPCLECEGSGLIEKHKCYYPGSSETCSLCGKQWNAIQEVPRGPDRNT
jgi:DnaJ-class molecular chaperone